MRLGRSFYDRHVLDVAQGLLGKMLILGNHQGVITETEAYRGFDDEASHAYKGPTPRNFLMFGDPGYSYVYLIYGMYFCLSLICEEKGQAAAVMLRGIQLPGEHVQGPGKLCQKLGISKEHHGINLCESNVMYVKEARAVQSYQAMPRIGIKKATDKLWRFVMTIP